MLTQFDDKTLLSAVRLLANDDHQKLIDWMEKESTRIAKEGMELQDIEAVRWYQGGFQLLDELIDKLKTARDVEEAERGNLSSLPKGEII